MTNVTILDGGMGQLLQHRSKLPANAMWSANSMLGEPDLVEQLHAEYIAAGAEAITINAYAASPERLEQSGNAEKFDALQDAAMDVARKAVAASGKDVKITGSMPPLFSSYNPDLNQDEGLSREIYTQIVAKQEPVDIHFAETLGSLLEVRSVLAAFEQTQKPCWLAVSLADQDGAPVLRSGEPLQDAMALVAEAGIDGFLLNCSAPETITAAMPVLSDFAVPYGAYANGFTKVQPLKHGDVVVDMFAAREDLGPDAYADFADQWIDMGATLIGGCCETEPAHIAELSRRKALRK